MYADLTKLCIHEGSNLGEAVALMDRARLRIILVVDERRRLIGTVTDGDLRRTDLEVHLIMDTYGTARIGRCEFFARSTSAVDVGPSGPRSGG